MIDVIEVADRAGYDYYGYAFTKEAVLLMF